MILQPVNASGGASAGAIRESIPLIGDYDGANRIFTLPEPAVHSPPNKTIKVYHGGRRLQPVEYQLRETSPGEGYDIVQIIFAPQVSSRLYADYWIFG